jgi:hypothetical protein
MLMACRSQVKEWPKSRPRQNALPTRVRIPRLCFLTFDPGTLQSNRFDAFRVQLENEQRYVVTIKEEWQKGGRRAAWNAHERTHEDGLLGIPVAIGFTDFHFHLSNRDILNVWALMGPVIPLPFSTQITGACLSRGPHNFAVTSSHTLSYLLSSFVVGVGGSLQTLVNVFTYVLWTFAYRSCWRSYQRGQQQGGQYHAIRSKGHHAYP